MRAPGIRLHKLALFGWAVVVTAVLLLLSLPVLAGVLKIAPVLNLANCWNVWYVIQSAGNHLSLYFFGIFRDYTPEFICCIGLSVNLKKVLHKGYGTLAVSISPPTPQLVEEYGGEKEGKKKNILYILLKLKILRTLVR
jgi:hypothetical protein